MTWLTDLVNSAKELEPPQSFWYWSGLCAISAIVKDNVYLPRGTIKDGKGEYYRLYPNIFVMLYADSGLKKGPPVNFAKKLVKKIGNTKVIVGRSSMPAILKEMGTAETHPGGKINLKSTAFIVASEFSSSIVSDPAAMDILTDLYDRQWNEGDWKSLLKMDTFKLIDPTVSLLVATNEAHIENFVQEKDKKGGFFGRMFVISETEGNRLNPLIDDLDAAPDVNIFLPYMKEVSKLVGPFKGLANTEVGEIYKKWYMDFYTQLRDLKIKDETGTMNRFGDSVLKVAMLLSISERLELEISVNAMNEAIERSEKLIGSVRKATVGKAGRSSYAGQKSIIIEELMSRPNHMISQGQLLKKYWMHFTEDDLKVILPSLHLAGMITFEILSDVVMIVMPEVQYQELKRFYEGKNK